MFQQVCSHYDIVHCVGNVHKRDKRDEGERNGVEIPREGESVCVRARECVCVCV